MHCFHCEDEIPPGTEVKATISGTERTFCCIGCEAAAMFIEGAGLGNFYAHREQSEHAELRPGTIDYDVFDDPAVSAPYVRQDNDTQSATLYISDLYCPACVWLATEILEQELGVAEVSANPSTRRIHVQWEDSTIGLADILRVTSRVGFEPEPVIAGETSKQEERDYRSAIKRLVVAGIFGMQAMMLAAGLYAGEFHGMTETTTMLLRAASLVTILPVMFYAAVPFFRGALRGIRHRKPGMDVPVSLALVIAFGASVMNTVRHGDAVYFDSIAMFVALLCVSRFLEMRARHQADDQAEAVAALLPVAARKVGSDGQTVDVARAEIGCDDLLALNAGDIVAADGIIMSGRAGIDERLITGESRPVDRQVGDTVLAGTKLIHGGVVARVTGVGAQTHIGDITRMMEQAQAQRGTLQGIADRLATPFVLGVLSIAFFTGVYWYLNSPDQVVRTVLAVLIVACPCALSLATPTALAVTATALARRGVLLTQARILDVLKPGCVVVFDKTGTLTEGEPTLRDVETIDRRFAEQQLIDVAFALERNADHAMASAFEARSTGSVSLDAPAITHVGAGVSGTIEGIEYRIGKGSFVAELAATRSPLDHGVYLGTEHGLLARFTLSDELKPDTKQIVDALQTQGLSVVISSGDSADTVCAVARTLGVESWYARQTPADKLDLVSRLKSRGARVVMIGDGVNDAPVLNEADAAIAIGNGTALARASADAILLGDTLRPLADLTAIARRTRRTIRQSLAWAAGYNAIGVTLAACGLITPWMAAIGMTASSLLVIGNALRIGGGRTTSDARDLSSNNKDARRPEALA